MDEQGLWDALHPLVRMVTLTGFPTKNGWFWVLVFSKRMVDVTMTVKGDTRIEALKAALDLFTVTSRRAAALNGGNEG